MVEEMTSLVIRLRKENEEDNIAWKKIQLGKAIEAVGLCLFRCRSAQESKKFVQWMQRGLARKFIITRREFMTYYTMINRHYMDHLGDVTGEMVKQGIMMQIIGHIDKGQLPELYNLILTVGKSLGKRNLFAWTNSVMDKLGDIGIDDIVQLAYKACDLYTMMKEVNLECLDRITQCEISREIARISVFRNAPTILVDWWEEKNQSETSGSSMTTVGMRNLTLQELISRAEGMFELRYINVPYGVMNTPMEFFNYVRLMMARNNRDLQNQEIDSDDDSVPDLLSPRQELEIEEITSDEEKVQTNQPMMRCQFCNKELVYVSNGSWMLCDECVPCLEKSTEQETEQGGEEVSQQREVTRIGITTLTQEGTKTSTYAGTKDDSKESKGNIKNEIQEMSDHDEEETNDWFSIPLSDDEAPILPNERHCNDVYMKGNFRRILKQAAKIVEGDLNPNTHPGSWVDQYRLYIDQFHQLGVYNCSLFIKYYLFRDQFQHCRDVTRASMQTIMILVIEEKKDEVTVELRDSIRWAYRDVGEGPGDEGDYEQYCAKIKYLGIKTTKEFLIEAINIEMLSKIKYGSPVDELVTLETMSHISETFFSCAKEELQGGAKSEVIKKRNREEAMKSLGRKRNGWFYAIRPETVKSEDEERRIGMNMYPPTVEDESPLFIYEEVPDSLFEGRFRRILKRSAKLLVKTPRVDQWVKRYKMLIGQCYRVQVDSCKSIIKKFVNINEEMSDEPIQKLAKGYDYTC